MIPPHTCTPFCTGQRYCVEEGTHTMPAGAMEGASLEYFRMWLSPFYPSLKILRVERCPDVPRSMLLGIGPTGRRMTAPQSYVGYLVTVKES